MSTTTQQAPIPSPAPWKPTFLSHLSHMKSPEFVLSTLHPVHSSSTSTSPSPYPTPYIPSARFCIFRGMWSELPTNPHNTAPRNPPVYESDMPTFTSDVRMEKVFEIFATSPGRAERREQCVRSGGGGPVEAVWWIADLGVQWRMKGTAFVVAPDIDGEGESSGVRTVKSEVGRRMRVKEEGRGKEGEWSWERELTAQFGNNSPGLRGTFRAPPPGRPTSEPYDSENLKLGTKVEDLEDPVARKNFRVVIIRPEEVEETDISDPEKARRQKYTYNSETGEWTHKELWP